MKGRLIKIAGALYVTFALLIAHAALATAEAPVTLNADSGHVVVQAEPTLLDHQRLDNAGKKSQTSRDKYRIEVWTASWCGPCRRYKAIELPALLKAGFKVTVRDYDKDNPPKDVKSVPTVRIYYKGTYLQQKTYWRAKDIAKYVDNHLSLKG